jgi:hypothetical protein
LFVNRLRVAVGIDHAAQSRDELARFLAGALVGLAGAALIGDGQAGDNVVIVAGSSSHAMHRVVGSAAVSLARHSPVSLVVVPWDSPGRSGPRVAGLCGPSQVDVAFPVCLSWLEIAALSPRSHQPYWAIVALDPGSDPCSALHAKEH